MWKKNTTFFRDIAGNPEWERQGYLARSGSQSRRRICFILPARGASHIIIVCMATVSLIHSFVPHSKAYKEKVEELLYGCAHGRSTIHGFLMVSKLDSVSRELDVN